MTKTTKPVKRETLSSVRDRGQYRPIIVELATTYVRLRLKGCRFTYTVTYDQLFRQGAQNAAVAKRAEKLAARKGGAPNA